MAIKSYSLNLAGTDITLANISSEAQLFLVGDTDAEKPVTNLRVGWRYFAKDNNKFYEATSATTWAEIIVNSLTGAIGLRIENLTSDPGSPTVGQIWLRTDL